MDGLTGIDGRTFDGLKLCGYPAYAVSLFTYLGITIRDTLATNTFDPIAFGTGFALLTTSLGVIAAGVAIKRHTEPVADVVVPTTQTTDTK